MQMKNKQICMHLVDWRYFWEQKLNFLAAHNEQPFLQKLTNNHCHKLECFLVRATSMQKKRLVRLVPWVSSFFKTLTSVLLSRSDTFTLGGRPRPRFTLGISLALIFSVFRGRPRFPVMAWIREGISSCDNFTHCKPCEMKKRMLQML